MKSYAAFGEVNYDFTERLTATLGLRYTYEDKEGTYATQVFGGLDLTGLPPATAAELNRAKLSIFRPQSYTAADDGGSLSGRANLAYQFTDDLLGYVSYAYGYKSGGLNMSGLPLDAQNQPTLATAVIEDEKNTTYRARPQVHAARWPRDAESRGLQDGRRGLPGERRLESGDGGDPLLSLQRSRGARAGRGSGLRGAAVHGLHAARVGRLRRWREHGLSRRAVPARGADRRHRGLRPHRRAAGGLVRSGSERWASTTSSRWARGDLLVHVDSSSRSGYNSDTSASQYTWIDGYNVTNASVGYRFAERLGSRRVRTQPVRQRLHHGAHDPDRQFRPDPRSAQRSANRWV